MIDPKALPYAENGGAMSKTEAAIYVAFFIALLTCKLLGWYGVDWSEVFVPVAIAGAKLSLFRIIRNATHAAIRLADHDHALDESITAAAKLEAKHTLTPNLFKSHLSEMAS